MHNPTLRVLQVITLLSDRRCPMRLSQLSSELKVPKSTLLPILQTMTQMGYLGKADTDGYIPGPALISAGAAAQAAYSPMEDVRRCLRELVDKFGETCYYGILDGGQVLYLEKIDSPRPLRMLTAIGHRMSAYATGVGKALLMDFDREQLARLYPEPLQPLTEHTVTDLDTLAGQLEQARSLGYCWEVEESTEHIRCFGVPVRSGGKTVGAISMAIPLFRYEEEMLEPIVKALQAAAAKLSEKLRNL